MLAPKTEVPTQNQMYDDSDEDEDDLTGWNN